MIRIGNTEVGAINIVAWEQGEIFKYKILSFKRNKIIEVDSLLEDEVYHYEFGVTDSKKKNVILDVKVKNHGFWMLTKKWLKFIFFY